MTTSWKLATALSVVAGLTWGISQNESKTDVAKALEGQAAICADAPDNSAQVVGTQVVGCLFDLTLGREHFRGAPDDREFQRRLGTLAEGEVKSLRQAWQFDQ